MTADPSDPRPGVPLFTPLETRNITVAGHRTSIKLEPYLWEALEEICHLEGMTVSELCGMVKRKAEANRSDAAEDRPVTLTSMIRVFILLYFRQSFSLAGLGQRRRRPAGGDTATDPAGAGPDSDSEATDDPIIDIFGNRLL